MQRGLAIGAEPADLLVLGGLTGDAAAGSYAALFVVMLLSWAGLPIAGQAALAAAGVLAAKGGLHIVPVLLVATAGSAAGGVIGYRMGLHGGRAVFTAPGPLQRRRERELVRGERLVDRYGALAVFMVPMWVPGVYRMEWRRFLAWNLIASIAWTALAGLGGYWIGPGITKALGRVGAAVAVGAAVIVLTAIVAWLWRRRRAAQRSSAETD
jgi:membrane-associated protein